MGERIRAFDWSSTSLGHPSGWPETLRTLIRVMLASRQPMFIAWGPERRMLYNDGYAPLCGNKHPGALGRRFEEVWADIIDDVGPIMDAAYAGVPTYMEDIQFVMRRYGRDEETHFSFGYTPVRDEASDTVVGMFCTCLEITSEVLLSREREREVARMRELFEQAPAATAVMSGRDHVFEIANAAYIRLVGNRDVIGRPLREALPEIAEQGFETLLDQVYATGLAYVGSDVPIEFRRGVNAPVETRILDFVFQPIRSGGADKVRGIFVQAADVTEKRAAEKMQRLLNQELSHRMKNQLAVVQSIVTQSLRNASSLDEARGKVTGRLEVLARAHDMLLTGKTERATIADIVASAIGHHEDEPGLRFDIEGPPIEFGSQAALSLALVVQELSTNAAKYGALSVPEGRVTIRWNEAELNGERALDFAWKETGGPPVSPPTGRGFGSRLVLGGISGAVSHPTLDFEPDGLRYRLLVSLARAAPR
ncbi:sensor histidine kinase [Chthonobacter rhizosphaerae]|uniref:sensor histidine kinase n=1 Tax=Chthonobacter rhizosphaerae TaxID=2735553 RepID=UPI0015EEE09A|nr:HWE histidine kinase domain-containing protein [Chthonobacter rhizosphaerae]